MRESTRHPERFECEQVLDRLEAYVDGELPAIEQALVRRHLTDPDGCAPCARELGAARCLRDALRELPEEEFPPALADRALDRARTEGPGESAADAAPPGAPANDDLPAPRSNRWLGAAAAALVLIAFGIVGLVELLPNDPAPSNATLASDPADPGEIDAAEIARATEEARLALAYVASVGRRSALVLRDEVVGDHIIGPSARALQRAMEPLRPRRSGGTPGADPGDRR